MKIVKFLKDWTLPISMVLGVAAYILYVNLHFLDSTHQMAHHLVGIMQPVLIFAMLFLSFCKVNPCELRIRRWHGWLILIQAGTFVLLSLGLIFFPNIPARVVVEGAIICMICPTATAAVVVTDKLGGNTASITSYTILANIVTAIIVPILLPLVHPIEGMTFIKSFFMILSKVFPLLICPFLMAWLVRAFFPNLHKKFISVKDLAFYLWAVALALAIAVTVRALVHSEVALSYEIGIAGVSLLCCILQFYLGKRIGLYYADRISAGQALGQKNTVFAIWMSYTFLTPITAVAGGFYSVWHNTINSYQLYKKRKGE